MATSARAALGGSDVRKTTKQTKVRRVRRTPTELGQTTPRTQRDERAKAAALKATEKGGARAARAAKQYGATTAESSRRDVAKVKRRVKRKLAKGTAAAQRPSASAFTKKERTQRLRDVLAGRTEVKTGQEIERERTSALAPPIYQAIRTFLGDEPGATAPTLGEAASVLSTVGSGGVGAALKVGAAAKAAGQVAKAGKAAKAGQAVTKARTAKAVKETGKVRSIPKRAAIRTKARYSAPQRKLRRKQRVEKAATRAVNPIAPAVGQTETVRALAEGHVKALTEDPIGTLKTTERAALGMPIAVAGDVVDLATGNVDDFVQSQKDYAKVIAKLFSGDEEKVARTVKGDVGLVPLATAALGGVAGVRAARSVGPKKAPKVRVSRARKRDEATLQKASVSPQKRAEARERLSKGEYREPLRQRHKGRKRAAQRSATTAEIERGLTDVEMRETGRRVGRVGPRRNLEADLARLDRKPVRGNITEGDLIRYLGEQGLTGREPNLGAILQRERDSLKPSRKEFLPEDKHTRAVLDALIEKPGVIRNKRVQDFLNRAEVLQGRRAIERASELSGKPETKPTLSDEEVRLSGVMRSEGVLRSRERPPAALEGVARFEPTPGVEAAGAIRAEAMAARKTAKTTRQKARREQAKATAAARELNVRRVADVRRTVVRGRSQKLRNLEKRLAAWESKAAKAKRPDTKARYQAKVRDLKRQITDTKATLTMAASPARLRAVKRVTEAKRSERDLRTAAAAEETHAATIKGEIDHHRRAAGLERQAGKLESQGKRPEAQELRNKAEELRDIGDAEVRWRQKQAVREAEAKVTETGRREPIYFQQSDVTTKRTPDPDTGVAYSRKAKKEQFRRGTLAQQGRIDESAATLLTNLHAQRITMSERARQRSFVDEEFHVHKGERLGTAEEWAKRGIPDGHTLVPIQEVAPAIQRTPLLRREVEAKRLNVKGAGEKGTIYGVVSKAALREHRAQAENLHKGTRAVRAASRAQGISLLGTSPQWFGFQIPATAIVLAARHPNPAAWVRAARHGIDIWRNASERAKAEFWGAFGANSADFAVVGNNVRGAAPARMADLQDGVDLALRSPTGRMLVAIGRNVKSGGPLIRANRRYEAAMRKLDVLLEMDRRAGLNTQGNVRISARPKKFVASVARAQDTIYGHMNDLRGKTPAERIEWYNRHPEKARELQRDVFDSAGDWGSLTRFEKGLSAVVMFYPFMRFSLRWIHWSFPKNNPVKAAIALNLSQQNAQELEVMLGGPPSFFTGWGQVITHVGDERQLTNLARAAPGGNALIEAGLGSDELNLATLTRPLQPAIGTVLNALEEKDPFGRPKDASTLDLILSGAAGLTAPTRPLRDDIIPPSDYSRLFRAMEGRENSLEENLVPDVIQDIAEQQQIAHVGRLLDVIGTYQENGKKEDYRLGSDERKEALKRKKAADAAYDEIDKLMVEYGIQAKKDQKKETEQYYRRKYGPDKSESQGSAFDDTFGGGSTGGGSGGAFEQTFGGGGGGSGGGGGAFEQVFGS